jgi:hypothetical protein
MSIECCVLSGIPVGNKRELGEMVAADLWLPTAIDPNSPERRNHNYGESGSALNVR